VWSDGDLAVLESTIDHNAAGGSGGGVFARGTLSLSDTTISANRADGRGGGLYTRDELAGLINNTTLHQNVAALQGGGVFVDSTPFISIARPRFRNSILAGNESGASPGGADCFGAAVSEGHNLLGDGSQCFDFAPAKGDFEGTPATPLLPRLGPLADNGGPTPTHAPLAGSPAIDAADPDAPGANACELVDQRGVGRSGRCDVGAYEVSPACAAGGGHLCLNAGRFRVTGQFAAGPQQGTARAVTLTGEAGYLWFFRPDNVEVVTKVLNGCGLNGRYWVFSSGLTNVETTLTVTDTARGTVKTYPNPAGRVFQPVLDTAAFDSCP
jgi:hypothetical protein